MRPVSLDSCYFGCRSTYFFLSCSEQGTSYPPLAESILYKDFVVRKDCTIFTLTSTAIFFIIPNWWPWSLKSFSCPQSSANWKALTVTGCGGTVSKGLLRTLNLSVEETNNQRSFSETEREVLGVFESAFWSVGFLLLVGLGCGFFAGYQCEESVSL